MRPETDPPQPGDVTRAIAEALGVEEPGPDPWWQAGIEESVEDGRAAPA